MQLTSAQKIIASDNHRFRVLNCGRRFGKTTEAVEEIKAMALASQQGDKIVYIAPTIQQARDIAWNMLKNELRTITLKTREAPSLEMEVMNKNGERILIMLRGWEAIETLRGQNFRFIVLDEVASMRNFWVGWNEVLSPTLIDRKGDVLFISTPKGFNHFYDLYNMELKDSSYKSFHFTSYDNPYLPIEELEREKKVKPENTFAQEYMADFRKQEGLVYKEFNRDKHLYSVKQINIVDTLVPIDWGWTNPAAILKIVRDTDNNFYITKEWYKREKTTAEIIEMAKSFGGNKYYPDPAEPDRIEMARKEGLNVREVSKDIEAGIDAVQELFKTNRLFIHESCTNLIAELETYSYPEKKDNNNEAELPIKENDHAMDAMRYALYMQTSNVRQQAKQFIPVGHIRKGAPSTFTKNYN